MKPISVVLLDDDRLVLDDLKSLIDWENLGFSLNTTANSSQALQYIRKYHPQIFITDIVMPGINGLTLIETLQKTHPDLKILIISSYDEFDYAKRAIKLGVCDYILKNEITASSLTEKLLSLAYTVQESALIHRSLLTQELIAYFETSSSITFASKNFTSILQERFLFFAAAQEPPFCSNSQDLAQITAASLRFLSASLKDTENISIAFQFVHDNFLIFAVRMKKYEQAKQLWYNSIPKQLLQMFSARAEHPCILFFLSKPLNIENFHALYRELLPLLHFYSVFHSSSLIDIKTLKEKELYVQQKRSFSFQLLGASDQHPEETLASIRQFLTQCYDCRDLQAILNFYQTFCFHTDFLCHGKEDISSPGYFSTLESLLTWISDVYTNIQNQNRREAERQYSLAVKSAMDYIRDHYSDYELNAECISRHAALSPSRLNTLFKEETGQTLNDYLTELRIREALYFLENTNLKIYEISEKCGYKSSQYFSHVFRQRTGKRPLDFRRRNRN